MALGPDDLVMSPGVVGSPDPVVVAAACEAAGAAAVSIWGTYAGEHDTPADVATRFADAGVPVFTVEAAVAWSAGPEAAAAEADAIVGLAAAVGAEGLFAVSMEGGDLDLARAIEGYALLCDRAAAHGLWAAIEFLPWSSIPNLATARAIVDGAARDNGGLVVDAWHFERSGSTLEEARAAAPLVRDYQVSDTAPVAESDLLEECMHRRLLPGDGTAPVIELTRALDAGGARCPVAIEVFSDELAELGPIEATVRAADATRRMLATARADGAKGE